MASGRVLALVVVLGGLRPDMVTADVMPNLVAFGGISTTYASATTVFPGVTPVTAASLATGALPRSHGIVGSEVFWPAVARDRVLNLEDHSIARAADQSLGGRLVDCATFADVLAGAGRRVALVAAGASSAAHLINPRAAQNGHWTFCTADRLASPTPAAWDETIAQHGFPPERELPRFEEVRYATDVMIDKLTAGDAPDVGVLWLCEPGDSARYRELGSLVTESAMRHVDKQLGRLLGAIDHRHGLERTLVVVVSDRGCISSAGEIDVAEQMRVSGPAMSGGSGSLPPGRLVASGSFGAFYGEVEADGSQELASWLLRQEWVGSLFMRGVTADSSTVKGSMPLSQVGLDHPRAPLLLFTLASDLGLDQNGLPGRGLCNTVAGGAVTTYGGLNPNEMRIVLSVAGPGHGRNVVSTARAGIVDIAPTLLRCLGLDIPASMIGRDLVASEMQSADEFIPPTQYYAVRD